jgi:outer membrane biosynthesis protein TonB
MRTWSILGPLALLLLLILGLTGCTLVTPQDPAPPVAGTVAGTVASTASGPITATATLTDTGAPTATLPLTSTVTPTPTVTLTVTPTVTPTTAPPTPMPVDTPTPEPTATPTPLPSPTATPTALPTPTPTSGPPPTPTPLPGTVFLGNHRSFSEGSALYVVGEAINGGAAPVYGVTVIATFYDSAGALVGATEGRAALPQTIQTQANPFKLRLDNAPSAISRYELTLRWDELSLGSFDRATITREEVSQENGVRITGDIRNDHSGELSGLVAVATFYDSSGQVLDVLPGNVGTTALAPGASTTFTLQSSRPIPYVGYLVQIEGMIGR